MAVLSVGECVVDWLSLEPGKTLHNASDFYRALGGNASNVAIGLRRLGTDVKLIAKIGDDFHGQFLMQSLKSEDILLDHVLIAEGIPTAQCYMTTTAEGEHHFHNWPRPNAAHLLSTADLPVDVFRTSAILHATGISLFVQPRREAIYSALKLAQENSMAISFDATFPTGADEEARRQMEDLLHKIHIIKMNEGELRFWSGAQGAIEDLARRVYLKYKPTVLLVTLAEKGSFVVNAKGVIHCPPLAVQSTSGVGAGDAYIAGVLHGIDAMLGNSAARLLDLANLTLQQWQQIGTAGNVAGALATCHPSAFGGMPTKEQMMQGMGKLAL